MTGRLALVVAALAVTLGSGAPAAAETQLVADHLARPRGLALAPDGTLYATLVGSGGRRCNFEGCFGASGRVVRVGRRGSVHTVASGLLSMRGKPDGFFSLGADQLTMLPDGRLATAVSAEFNGLGGKPPAAVPRRLRSQIGRIVLVGPGRRKQLGPDVAAVEYRFDPDGEGEVSNPFGIAAIGDVLYVSDSAANDLLAVRAGVVGLPRDLPAHRCGCTVGAGCPDRRPRRRALRRRVHRRQPAARQRADLARRARVAADAVRGRPDDGHRAGVRPDRTCTSRSSHVATSCGSLPTASGASSRATCAIRVVSRWHAMARST
jgi:hypothetical protein